ncbi:MAG: hypothetical protein A2516_09495 [Alphaproteobacteria bacterium RIFOXYD12_FULL_60_8]|nr:MAG: hypothetical protein A2516_09495 [Alphaproteobacteria bacterium RIFOXYD12_FULL_60_8]
MRTEHFFNDIHHQTFLILFVSLLDAVRKESAVVVENCIDNITVYLFIHFLDEEEGMTYARSKGWVLPDALAEHAAVHINLVQWWNTHVFFPFKKGELTCESVFDLCRDYCMRIIDHIGAYDLKTYGPTVRDTDGSLGENAHISLSRLPLSPYMPGALQIVTMLAPDVVAEINPQSIAPAARLRLPALRLCAANQPVLPDGRGSYRDILYRGNGGIGVVSSAW